MKNANVPPLYFFIGLVLIGIVTISLINFILISLYFILLGILLMLFGILIIRNARQLLKKHETTLSQDTSSRLVTEGLYRFTRNPIYLGMFLFLLGISISLGNIFGIIISILFLMVMNKVFIPLEERRLEETFGDEYRNYKTKVHRWV